jgi:hypothetical protein
MEKDNPNEEAQSPNKNFSSDLSAAVHAIIGDARRARALMPLLEEPLDEPAGRMRRKARKLMRALAHARDFQSALDAAKDLRKGNKLLPKTSLRVVSSRIWYFERLEPPSFLKKAAADEIRGSHCFRRAVPKTKRPPLLAAVFTERDNLAKNAIVTRGAVSSLAGLAATYSSKS